MNQSVAGQAAQSVWGGGVAPFATSWQKLMMWIFIVTDALLFAGLLVGYGVIRVANGSWPHQAEV
ncbi:MAG: cytochrome c oxidase subunit 3, partial [Vicinamibacteria bacterium]